MTLSPLNQRRWRNFKRNRRAFWSLWIFLLLFGLSLFAEFLAYNKPILISYRGEFYTPIWQFYPESAFGGDFQTEAVYRDPEVQCLIATGGINECLYEPEMVVADAADGTVDGKPVEKGWMIWPEGMAWPSSAPVSTLALRWTICLLWFQGSAGM